MSVGFEMTGFFGPLTTRRYLSLTTRAVARTLAVADPLTELQIGLKNYDLQRVMQLPSDAEYVADARTRGKLVCSLGC